MKNKIQEKLDLIKIYISKYNKDVSERKKKKEFESNVGGMLKISFSEKSIFESILIYESFCKKFESELARKGLDIQIESSVIDDFFKSKELVG